jgi:hypothetical protein
LTKGPLKIISYPNVKQKYNKTKITLFDLRKIEKNHIFYKRNKKNKKRIKFEIKIK